MQGWRYRVLIIFTLMCTACSSRPDQPSAQVVPTPVPQDVGAQAKPSQNKPSETTPLATRPSPDTKLVTARTTNSESGVRLPEINPLEVEGNIYVTGSSTVFPLSKAIYEHFVEYGYGGTIVIDSIGTGTGFKFLCGEGEEKADIVSASRPIQDEEAQACAARGDKPVEFRIGSDAVVVVVNSKNTFVSNVTKQELAALFTAEKWSDVNPKWPKEKIERFLTNPGSTRLGLFAEKVLDDNEQQLMNSLNTQFTDDNDYIVQAVASNPYAITLLPFSVYKDNADKLKALSIDGVEPRTETVEDGTYLLTRPLFIYSEVNTIRNKPQVRAFINFYLTYINQEIEKVGYFQISQKELDNSKMNLLKAMESQ